MTWINTDCGLSAPVSCGLGGGSNAQMGFDDFDSEYRLNRGARPSSRYDPAFPVCLYVVAFGTTPYYRCSYTTMDQCSASANGQMCVLNSYYAGAKARGNNRRNYRQTYAPPKPPIRNRAAPYDQYEPYYGASQGYAPGEKERFFESMRRNL
jgi:hypothetical protein